MPLRLEIDGGQIASLDDIHDLVAGLTDLPEWFGRNLDALAELAYFVKQPLDIVIQNPKTLERHLGSRDYKALILTLEDIRDSKAGDVWNDWQPVSLTIKEH
jgi:RNAse (barnase) inhibitor barstar